MDGCNFIRSNGCIAGGMLILGISHELDCDAATVANWNEIIPYLITAAGMLLGLGAARDASR